MTAETLLVRHPSVAKAWMGRCYGRSDVPLGREGRRTAAALAESLGLEQIETVVHSGARRTADMAGWIADRRGCEVQVDHRWLERDFGDWEGRTWHSIWRESGDLMDGMTDDPHGFRPGGGETTGELAKRVAAAWDALDKSSGVLVVAHGGPLAVLRTSLLRLPLERVAEFIPICGQVLRVDPTWASACRVPPTSHRL